MRGGCEGKSRDDGSAKHASRGRSSLSRESGETREPTSDLAVDADLHSLGFFLFFFPCAPSRHRVFTVIKSVIKAAFVLLCFPLERCLCGCRGLYVQGGARVSLCTSIYSVCIPPCACVYLPSCEARATSCLSASSNRKLRTNWLKATREHIGGKSS